LDNATGVIHFRGERLALALPERELLGVMLRRAGQILSHEHLARLLGSSTEAVDRRMEALSRALDSEGVRLRPRVANGLGYILWR
jgi:DNA-binding response OmpR family regulator